VAAEAALPEEAVLPEVAAALPEEEVLPEVAAEAALPEEEVLPEEAAEAGLPEEALLRVAVPDLQTVAAPPEAAAPAAVANPQAESAGPQADLLRRLCLYQACHVPTFYPRRRDQQGYCCPIASLQRDIKRTLARPPTSLVRIHA
jgi:hypothetical protein